MHYTAVLKVCSFKTAKLKGERDVTKEELYKRVCSVCPLEKTDFEEDLSCAIRELCAMFGDRYVRDESAELLVKESYIPALCSAVLFFRTGEESDRRRFLERAKDAFLTVWRQNADKRRKKEETMNGRINC